MLIEGERAQQPLA